MLNLNLIAMMSTYAIQKQFKFQQVGILKHGPYNRQKKFGQRKFRSFQAIQVSITSKAICKSHFFSSQLGPARRLFVGPFEKRGGKYIIKTIYIVFIILFSLKLSLTRRLWLTGHSRVT